MENVDFCLFLFLLFNFLPQKRTQFNWGGRKPVLFTAKQRIKVRRLFTRRRVCFERENSKLL